jgi:type II secretion system protein N
VKERLLKYARYADLVGYPLFYVVSLVVFASLTFPYAKLKEHMVASFNGQQRTSGGPQELQIDEMSGYWLSGVRMKGVRLMTASTEPGQPPQKIEVEEATVRYSILSGLFGSSDMTFDVQAFGGEATGTYETHGKDQSIEVALEAIDLGRVEPLVGILGVPLRGKLAGTVKLTMLEGKASKGGGSVSLEASEVSVGDGKAKIKGAFALPPIIVGTIAFAAEAKDGTLKITKLVAGGKDLDLQGDGRVAMRELATDSLCDAQVRFKVNEGYRGKNDITRSLFGTPGSNAPALFELADPRIKQSKRPDGFYAWIIRGPLGRPELIPAGGAVPGLPPPAIPVLQ